MKPRSAKGSSVERVSETAELRARLLRAEEALEAARAEAADAREQQRAASAILKVISASPADVQPVFDAIVRSAVRLGDAQLGTLFRLEGGMIHVAAHCNLNAEAEALFARVFPQPINDGSPYGRAMLQAEVVNMPDLEQFAFSEASRQRGRVLGARGVLAVPMLGKEGVLGAVVIGRRAAGAFPDSCVGLLRTFADQAVLAIENVRLFHATREALEQQTATGEILQVISSSPTDLAPVFDAILRRATQLSEAHLGVLNLYDGEKFRTVAHQGANAAFAKWVFERGSYVADAGGVLATMAAERRPVQIPDVREASAYRERQINSVKFIEVAGARTFLAVPLLKDGAVIGAICVYRPEVRPFTEKHKALVSTFARQAVIAVENVRLFNETKEALERQTAVSEILRIIASSPADVRPMLQAVAERAVKLCQSAEAAIFLPEAGRLHFAAGCQTVQTVKPAEVIELTRQSVVARAFLDCSPVHIEDLAAATPEEYGASLPYQKRYGHRSVLAVPLLRDGRSIGVISLWRYEVRKFEHEHVALVRMFADQAAIAIENVRLFNETREALEQQTATGEILASISSSMSDVQPVFDAIVRNLLRLLGTRFAGVELIRDGQTEIVAAAGDPGFEKIVETFPRPLDENMLTGQVIKRRAVMQYAPIVGNPATPPATAELARTFGYNAIIAAPMVRGDKVIGAIATSRTDGTPFDEKQISLIKSFADQAVIAIENVRLFNETRQALDRQTATAEILKVIASSPSDVQPVFDAVVKQAGRLAGGCSVNVSRLVGEHLHLVAYTPVSPEADEALKRVFPVHITEVRTIAEAVRKRASFSVNDFETDPNVSVKSREIMRTRGFRSTLYVPIVQGEVVYGVMHVSKVEPGPFSPHWVQLLETFASQVVIAIENVRLFNETREALERQTATSEILTSISRSMSDAQPVFDAIARSVTRFLGTSYAVVQLVRDGMIHMAAFQGYSGFERVGESFPRPIDDRSLSGLVVKSREVYQLTPIIGNPRAPELTERNARDFKYNSIIVAPMLRDEDVIGVIATAHRDAVPFEAKHVELIRSFAAQAVIAVENARLFNETKEALERQTATSEVLKVISQTRIDLQPVLETVLDNARRLCDADRVLILRPDPQGNYIPVAARISNEASSNVDALTRRPIRLDRSTTMGRALLERRAVHIPDVLADPEYRRKDLPVSGGFRTALSVPMLRDGEPIGAMTLTRAGPPRPFSPKQIELVTTFADQAVIAIENVRLFNETTEALEQLEATAEVLRAIGSSIADAAPVFEKILESCQRLFQGYLVGLNMVEDDGQVHIKAYQGPRKVEMEKIYPLPLSRESGTGCAILDRAVVHYADVEAEDVPDGVRTGARVLGFKSIIFAPLLAEGQGIGALWVGRLAVGAFPDKQIALLKTFADQAVIAIQNARLFGEIKEKSTQLEVANRHKSEFLANMSHELRTPLNAIIGFTRIVMRRSKEQLEPKQYENLEKILSSGQHLLQLINAILDLSKVEAGRVEVHAAELLLAPVIEQCVKTVEPLVKAPGVQLIRDFDGGLPQVYQDEEKLRQIIINLLSNAVKFTERGTVKIRAEANGGSFAVAVADTGIGIPREKLEHVFEEFAQADASSTRVYGGTGLGLTIARRLARLMGGEISVDSAPGVGSTFTLTLPVRYHA